MQNRKTVRTRSRFEIQEHGRSKPETGPTTKQVLYGNGQPYNMGVKILAALIVVWLIVMLFFGLAGLVQAIRGKLFEGIGAMGTRGTRFDHAGVIQGFGDRKHTPNADQSFLNSMQGPEFTDVPNYVLRKENRMQNALHAYGRVRGEHMARVDAGESPAPLPTWASYWSDWQKSQNYDYSGRKMYDASGGNVVKEADWTKQGTSRGQNYKLMDPVESMADSSVRVRAALAGM